MIWWAVRRRPCLPLLAFTLALFSCDGQMACKPQSQILLASPSRSRISSPSRQQRNFFPWVSISRLPPETLLLKWVKYLEYSVGCCIWVGGLLDRAGLRASSALFTPVSWHLRGALNCPTPTGSWPFHSRDDSGAWPEKPGLAPRRPEFTCSGSAWRHPRARHHGSRAWSSRSDRDGCLV